MITAAGLGLSVFLGCATRRLQVIIMAGPTPPRSIHRLTGYALSSALYVGVYFGFDRIIENNKKLIQRRLAILREQRAIEDDFFNFEEEPDHRHLVDRKGLLLNLVDRIGAPNK
ncbi:uncharacterized protein J8A68_004026 [[Candida] subhashii]|uniref:Uncharacterized protein n=1 Tax=[Candida] subhashii TaxID=561895 RepID=A0A8J5UVU7_9ASCO|nr:uncharacterized protein J8A68_004026 [[Candida] subhashii]KAG7662495.1 hypothetical protein J8A68_004026 [[Candida] subhashii]